jgi:nitroreductase
MNKYLLLITLFIINFQFVSSGFSLENDPMQVICQARHSGKEFDDSRIITPEQLQTMIEAARRAPSSHNEQPWHMVICDKYSQPDAFDKLLSTIKASNQAWAQKAQILVLITAKKAYTKNGKENPYALYDTGSAAISMALQATSLGLMTHQVGGFDTPKVIAEFQIPEGFQPITIMVVGYEKPGASYNSPERKAPSANFFYGKWAK